MTDVNLDKDIKTYEDYIKKVGNILSTSVIVEHNLDKLIHNYFFPKEENNMFLMFVLKGTFLSAKNKIDIIRNIGIIKEKEILGKLGKLFNIRNLFAHKIFEIETENFILVLKEGKFIDVNSHDKEKEFDTIYQEWKSFLEKNKNE